MVDGAQMSRTGLVTQSVDADLEEAPMPVADGVLVHVNVNLNRHRPARISHQGHGLRGAVGPTE